MSEQAGRYQRSFGGLIGSMVVLLLAVAAYVAFRAFFRGDVADPVQPVDYAEVARLAAKDADFALVAPEPLPSGWEATSVRYDNVGTDKAWHLGTLTDQRRYVGLEQADRPVSGMVEDFVDEEAARDGSATVAGETWEVWTDDGGDRALVRRDGTTTTLVVGPVSQQVLATFVGTLAPPPGA